MNTNLFLQLCGGAIIVLVLVVSYLSDFSGIGVFLVAIVCRVLFELFVVRPVLGRQKDKSGN